MKASHAVGGWLLLTALCASPVAVADQVTGRVPILWSTKDRVQLVPEVVLRPGMTVDVAVSGQVDVDHTFGENRRCRWFGLDCWYEQWDRANMVPASQLELELELDEGSVTKVGDIYRITIPIGAGNANFANRLPLRGMLWKQGRVPPTQRGPCVGRPQHCSQGDVLLTFSTVNVDERLKALDQILMAQKIGSVDVDTLTGADYFDPFVASESMAAESTTAKLAAFVAKAADAWRNQIQDKTGPTSGGMHLKVIQLASAGLRLRGVTSEVKARLSAVITESYLDRRDFAAATQEAPKLLGDAKSAYAAAKTAANALLYARALKASAAAWREKSAKNSSTDIRVAIAMLDEGTRVLWDHSATSGVSRAVAELNIDAARMLNLLRTEADLRDGEARLVTAICFQQHGEKGGLAAFDTWRSTVVDPVVGDCKTVTKPAD